LDVLDCPHRLGLPYLQSEVRIIRNASPFEDQLVDESTPRGG